eukprot:11829600-Ditylum_brightwellii.AAC.1
MVMSKIPSAFVLSCLLPNQSSGFVIGKSPINPDFHRTLTIVEMTFEELSSFTDPETAKLPTIGEIFVRDKENDEELDSIEELLIAKELFQQELLRARISIEQLEKKSKTDAKTNEKGEKKGKKSPPNTQQLSRKARMIATEKIRARKQEDVLSKSDISVRDGLKLENKEKIKGIVKDLGNFLGKFLE